MKLTKPTDAQLNAAFAEKVCGWRRLPMDQIVFEVPATGACGTPPDFVNSADAVLPWLMKYHWEVFNYVGENRIAVYLEEQWDGEAKTFPKAAVIALLRAHGVEVEL